MADLINNINVGEDVKEQAYKICQEFLGPPWKNLCKSKFKISTVTGGMSNAVYRCSLPEDVIVKDPKTPSSVLLRIYGSLQETDKDVIVTEATTFMLLAERGLGPKLYGLFPNGRLEEFIPSRSLKSEDLRRMSTTTAREMAKIHALQVPVRKVPDFWHKNMKAWLNDVAINAALLPKESFECINMYKEEMNWLLEEMKKSNSPVVYCHNDLQGGNILLREDDLPSENGPRIVFIDFEFGAYNYRGFDFANHFCEWCFDYPTEVFPYFIGGCDKFPSVVEQTEYIRAYVDQLAEEGIIVRSAVDTEVDKILEEVQFFPMASHLLWSLWSMQMSLKSSTDLALVHMEHSKVRRKAYWTFKEIYLNSPVYKGKAESSSML